MDNKTTLIILTIVTNLLLLVLPVGAQGGLRIYPHNFINPRLQNAYAKLNATSKFSWISYQDRGIPNQRLLIVEDGNGDIPTDNVQLQIIPNYLNIDTFYGIQGDFYRIGVNFNRAYFNLREFQDLRQVYTVVTIEEEDNVQFDRNLSNVSPVDLVGTTGYSGVNQQTVFSWYSLHMKDGKQKRVVTLVNR